MKVYVSHSTNFDYKNELYEPLKQLKDVELILPHESSEKPSSSKDVIKSCHFMVAEVSYPSHGVGIEIGWADAFGTPIILLAKKGSKISSSLQIVSKTIIEYDKIGDILQRLEKEIIKN